IGTGSISINQTNPSDPHYIHPQVYDFLTKAGFYSQVELLDIKNKGGVQSVPITTNDSEYTYITIDYAKRNLVGKPINNQTNQLLGVSPLKVSFDGNGSEYGTTSVSMDEEE